MDSDQWAGMSKNEKVAWWSGFYSGVDHALDDGANAIAVPILIWIFGGSGFMAGFITAYFLGKS